ncbi:MAG: hypothetical protein H7338_07665 [Candidatus Sericytochromatia bacterium]|nr:hypothetical protein [Candidatus Sericytochromatia bacterium]
MNEETSGETVERTALQVQMSPFLAAELRKIAGDAQFPSLDLLIERWLTEKVAEWHLHRAGGRPQDESVEELANEKDRLLEWMANYVSAVQRSEWEMRQALEHIERLRVLIPHRPSAS